MEQKKVITRIWHGKTMPKYADLYLKYIRDTGIAGYLDTPGILSAKILRKMENDACHFWTITEWENIDSIKKFAGEDYEKAKYYPEDTEFLLEKEEKVIHCETFIYSKVKEMS